MSYNGRDSVMTLYTEPVCWSDNHQISADTIYIYMRNGTIDYARGIGSALAIQQETDTYFDQMAGKEMIAYIRDGELNVSGSTAVNTLSISTLSRGTRRCIWKGTVSE